MDELSRPDEAPPFGTEAFYAGLGRAFVVMCAVVPGLFLIEVVDWATGGQLQNRGVMPRDLSGISGIVSAPFLHVDWAHLYANSIPLIMLGTFVLAAGTRRFLWSTGLIIVIGGLGTWLFGESGNHIGASGVIFGFLGLLLTRGIVERTWWNVGAALLIGLLYWWQLAGIVPVSGDRISQEMHLFGFIGGVAAAIVFRRRRRKAPRVDEPGPDVPLPDFRLPRF